MPGRECYHCKEWIEDGAAHDCWTTTEEALTRDLPDDLRDAWERLRETAAEFGEQRIYASLNSIMFSRTACYLFVRPSMKRLEVCFFLGRTIATAPVRRSMPASRRKIAHIAHVTHRDQVEPPLTTWLREAYDVSEELSGTRARARPAATAASHAKAAAEPGRRTRKTAPKGRRR
jgi:Domain of unknown function (DUF5655)